MGSEEEGEDGNERIVVANGMDIDKRYFYEVSKRIGIDPDLWKLSVLGPPLWTLTLLLGAGLVVRSVLSSPPVVVQRSVAVLQTVVVWFGSGASNRQQLRERAMAEFDALVGGTLEGSPAAVSESFVFTFVMLALVLLAIPQLKDITLDVLRGGFDKLGDVATFISNIPVVFRLETWQNFNYWHPFTSHLSDRDPLIVLSEADETAVSGVFADEPHYGNVFIDSVYVEVDDDSTVQRPLLFALFGTRLRPVWRAMVAIAGAVLLVTLLDRILVFDLLLFSGTVDWALVTLVSGGFLLAAPLVPLVTAYSRRYVSFLYWFYANSAGLSSYSDLLNPKEVPNLIRDEDRNVLSNSLSGYGLFYLSEFFFQVFGDGRYDLALDSESLVESTGEMRFYNEPNDKWASIAATELLWSAMPADSVAAAESSEVADETDEAGETGEADVRVRLSGVDYYTTDTDGSPGLLGRLLNAVGGPTPERQDSKRLVKATAGSKRGIRLPVKRFMSVPDETHTDVIDEGPDAVASLYSPDEWADDSTHTVLLGGGEHQQGINKLVLSMKAQGYDNVDVLENAFTGASSEDDETDSADEADATEAESKAESPAETTKDALSAEADDSDSGDETLDIAEFPTEYFVSFVGGDTSFFRDVDDDDTLGNRDVFLLMRHQVEENPDQFVHVVTGMSAVATKTGFLYWYDRFSNDGDDGPTLETELEPDTLYIIHHPDPKGHAGLDAEDFDALEIGTLYLDTSWLDADSLGFDLQPDHSYDWVAHDDGIDIEYHALDITYDAPGEQS
ncbi:MAG: hypothetical protein ACI8U4_002206 [Natronomonas sp.]|jgi:hypothetical protein